MIKAEVVPGYIFTVSEVLSPQECDEYIELSEARGYGDAPISTAGGFVMRKDVRNNTRVMFDDHAVVEELWSRLAPFIPERIQEWRAVGLNERLRFYRYEPDQYFAWHYDGCFRRENGEESKLTLMVYLNDDCQGGETRFELRYPPYEVTVKPSKGMALLFDHYIFHEGSRIISGLKYVLRSDVMYKNLA